MTLRRALCALALVASLAGCAGSDQTSASLPPNYLAQAPDIIANTDWSQPDAVTVAMVNYEFQPSEITLRRDRPVRLVFVNSSSKDHSVVSPDFFREVATYQITEPNGSATKAPWLSKLVVAAGQTRELWLVPAHYGAYRFECDVTGHASLGMTGLINVVP
jgi:uncharacterized cupredoxin-like copper-binding protein